jgi:hypothetical protein
MYRQTLGRGRRLAAVGAIIMLVGCVLPWFTIGGTIGGLPPYTGNAFDSTGILVFLSALGTLALVTLPYAAGDRPVVADRWPPYLIMWLLGVLGVVLRILELWNHTGGSVLGLPDRSPGLWLVLIGLAVLARAVFEIAQSPQRT